MTEKEIEKRVEKIKTSHDLLVQRWQELEDFYLEVLAVVENIESLEEIADDYSACDSDNKPALPVPVFGEPLIDMEGTEKAVKRLMQEVDTRMDDFSQLEEDIGTYSEMLTANSHYLEQKFAMVFDINTLKILIQLIKSEEEKYHHYTVKMNMLFVRKSKLEPWYLSFKNQFDLMNGDFLLLKLKPES